MIRLALFGRKNSDLGDSVFVLKVGKVSDCISLICEKIKLTVFSEILLDRSIPQSNSATLIRNTSNRKAVRRFPHICHLFFFGSRNKDLSCRRTKATEGVLVGQIMICCVLKLLIIGIHDILLCFRAELIKEYGIIHIVLVLDYLLKGDDVLNELSS